MSRCLDCELYVERIRALEAALRETRAFLDSRADDIGHFMGNHSPRPTEGDCWYDVCAEFQRLRRVLEGTQ